jgi:hypothetical protein
MPRTITATTGHIHIEYYPQDQPEVQMVMEVLRMLSSERRHKFLSAEKCDALQKACATLKKPPSVAGPRSSAGTPRPSEADSGSRRVAPTSEEEVLLDGFLDLGHAPLTFTIDGRESKVHGPRQEGMSQMKTGRAG